MVKLTSSSTNREMLTIFRRFPEVNSVYSPKLYEKFGIIRKIATSIKVNDLINNAKSDLSIKSGTRIHCHDPNDSSKFIPTNSVEIRLKGNCIPKAIIIIFCILYVDYFISSLKKYFNCRSFGHIAKFCKSKEPRCLNCG